jgi:predicted NBD/HSP70 family sugar kinase
MQRAIGITVHTGWGACVVVGGSPREPEIVANRVIELLEHAERFCYHRAAEMTAASAREWLTRVRAKALARARSELAPLLAEQVRLGAIVAKDGPLPDLDTALTTHLRIHSAEGLFYRDVFRDACQIPWRIIPPASLEITALGNLVAKPWGRDQKLAALAAWQVMGP